jgi:hypothetical protein
MQTWGVRRAESDYSVTAGSLLGSGALVSAPIFSPLPADFALFARG